MNGGLIRLHLRVQPRSFTLSSLLRAGRVHELIAERALDAAVDGLARATIHELLVRSRLRADACS